MKKLHRTAGLWTAAVAALLFVAASGCDSSPSGSSGDTTAPTVVSTVPAVGAVDVVVNSNVIARFSEAMDVSTISITTFGVVGPAGVVAGSVSYDAINFVADFLPAAALATNTAYTATLSIGVKDVAGNSLSSPFSWGFNTGVAMDTTAPTVVSTNPADAAVDVPVNQIVSALFSESMDSATITTISYTLELNGVTPVVGIVGCPGTTATLKPSDMLAPNSSYTATLTTAVLDLAGNPLVSSVVWTFQTGTAVAMGPAAVNLGTAGNYAIIAKAGVSTTGVTSVVGDIGLSPAAGSFFTGFAETLDPSNVFSTSAFVTGQMFAANYATPTPANLTAAILDMVTAYADAEGRVSPDVTELGAGNIDGMTLAPGLYKWSTSVMIPISLTINGGANDKWIFQIAGDLTVNNAAIVTLAGGAQAKNIVWQVAGQAVFGTTSDFKGIVLCKTQIVLQTGAVLGGRVLAQTAVTLDATTLTSP